MTERPIICNAHEVRALLDGTKTQTRRVVKFVGAETIDDRGKGIYEVPWPWSPQHDGWVACPFGAPGDRLWVRETWCRGQTEDGNDGICYRASGDTCMEGLWRPSIHIPRWASRITLEVTGVRVERLNSISERDAMAEGVGDAGRGENVHGSMFSQRWTNYDTSDPTNTYCVTARESFASLWESINGPNSWERNPWVWAVSFRRVTP